MLGINNNVIRSVRRRSSSIDSAAYDPNDREAAIDRLLSTSPPDDLSLAVGDNPNLGRESSSDKVDATPSKLDKPTPKKAPRTTVVRDAVPKNTTEFTKVAIQPTAVASSLSKELESSGHLSRLRSTDFGKITNLGGGPTLHMKVFVTPGDAPLNMRVQGPNTVDDVIDLVIRLWTEQQRKPGLSPDSDAYELRMLDDDDGTPDMDMPPLERTGDIHRFNVSAVALCPSSEVPKKSGAKKGDTRLKRGVSLDLNMQGGLGEKLFLKVHMPQQQSHVIKTTKDMVLEDCLPLVAKKRSTDISEFLPQHWKFVYMDSNEALEMKMPLRLIRSDNLKLVRRDAEAELKTVPEMTRSTSSSVMALNKEGAGVLEKFNVYKKNRFGIKQRRIMKIDESKIYNEGADKSTEVQKQFRLMSDVQAVEVTQKDPKSFSIWFRDPSGKGSIQKEYFADSANECSKIVSKIRTLKGL